jgi:hypothetical protein
VIAKGTRAYAGGLEAREHLVSLFLVNGLQRVFGLHELTALTMLSIMYSAPYRMPYLNPVRSMTTRTAASPRLIMIG